MGKWVDELSVPASLEVEGHCFRYNTRSQINARKARKRHRNKMAQEARASGSGLKPRVLKPKKPKKPKKP